MDYWHLRSLDQMVCGWEIDDMADIKARMINTGNKCFISDCMAKDGYDFHYY